MELAIHNIKGKDTGRKAKLSNNIFAVEPNDHAIYLDVKQYLANNRKGLHKSKERAEIKGSTRKIKKQNHFSPHPANLKFIFHNMKALCHEFPETCQFIFSGNRTSSIDLIQRILYFGRKIWYCDLQYYIDARNYGLGKRKSKGTRKQNSRHKQESLSW